MKWTSIDISSLSKGHSCRFFQNYLNVKVLDVHTTYVDILVSTPFCDEKTFYNLKIGNKVRYFGRGVVFEILLKDTSTYYANAGFTIYAAPTQDFNANQEFKWDSTHDFFLNP